MWSLASQVGNSDTIEKRKEETLGLGPFQFGPKVINPENVGDDKGTSVGIRYIASIGDYVEQFADDEPVHGPTVR